VVLVSALDVAVQSLAVTDPDGARVKYAARPTDQVDPWAVIGAPSLSGATPGAAGPGGVLPAGIGLTGGGGLEVAGLEWLGARAYDPSVRGFLSTDPLAPVLGAGWDGNPYAYAGNNPLNATDPTGLSPLTDAELKAYDGSSGGGAFAAVADWTADNRECLAGGGVVIAGGALMATGVGGPAGMMLIGAGADTIIQKAHDRRRELGTGGLRTQHLRDRRCLIRVESVSCSLFEEIPGH
jgi:RHS repeat-associated protein